MLKESILINRIPKEVFDWISNIAENYKAWHKDHVLAKWEKGRGFEPGSILYSEEYLGKSLEKLRFKITKIIPGRSIEFKLMFPESIICSGGSFRFEPVNNSTLFTATLDFHFEYILSKLFSSKLNEIKNHMIEEGENLKEILENS